MIHGKRILAVVPARGGSKGIPLKNIQQVLGTPLVARVGHLVQDMPEIDRAVVSTDHPEIARIAEESGLDVPFFRPPELSGDRVGDWEVLKHALVRIEEIDQARYDVVVMLQPTSPLRKKKHVMETVKKLILEEWDAVWTVSETDPKNHPLKQLTVHDARIGFHDPRGEGIIARQQLDTLFHKNGAAYAFTRECLLEQETICGRRTGALVVDDSMISIDTPWDLRLAEFLLREREENFALGGTFARS
jgi:CMP-N-acetylneuraminic acid synthetase